MQNGEHTDEWPAADRPFSGDDSDAPVTMGESSITDESTTSGELPAPEESTAADTPWPGVGENADDAAAVASDEPAPDLAPTDEATAYAAADTSDTSDDSLVSDAADDAAAGADITDADNVEITNGGARDIDATTVNITQGGARDIEATNVTINQGGAARISAEQVTVSQGGVGLARAEQLTLQDGGNAFAVVADKAHFDAETSVFLLISGSTSGEVKPVLDWRAALAIGAGFALVMSALRRLRR